MAVLVPGGGTPPPTEIEPRKVEVIVMYEDRSNYAEDGEIFKVKGLTLLLVMDKLFVVHAPPDDAGVYYVTMREETRT